MLGLDFVTASRFAARTGDPSLAFIFGLRWLLPALLGCLNSSAVLLVVSPDVAMIVCGSVHLSVTSRSGPLPSLTPARQVLAMLSVCAQERGAFAESVAAAEAAHALLPGPDTVAGTPARPAD